MASMVDQSSNQQNDQKTFAQIHGLDPSKLPEHLAIIMDGNGRWAKKRLMNRVKGHEKGLSVVQDIVETCRKLEIPVLTLYAFSTENWKRPRLEVEALMRILKSFLKSELQKMLDNNIRLNAIGQIHRLPEDVRQRLEETMRLTEKNDGMLLNLALSYGSRSEIVRMVRQIAQKSAEGQVAPDQIDEAMISAHLYTSGMPDPDLLIRTSGEMRISNFLLWQIAYAELYITDTLWPDFNGEELIQILTNFQTRERRFGEVKEP